MTRRSPWGDGASQDLRRILLTPRRLELCGSTGHDSPTRWLYNPGRVAGRLALATSLALRLRGSANRDLPFDLHDIATRFGFSYRSVALMKSSGRERWTAAYLTANGEALVMKIGHANSSDSIREEHLTQRQFAGRFGQFSVPNVHQFIEHESWSAFTMGRIHPVQGHPKFNISEAARIAIDLALLKGSGVTHGDFAPWNVIHSSVPWLVDWEHAGPFEPGVDLAHYVLASALIARFIPVKDIPLYLGSRSDTLTEYIEATNSDRTRVLVNVAKLAERFRRDYPGNRELRRCLERLSVTNA